MLGGLQDRMKELADTPVFLKFSTTLATEKEPCEQENLNIFSSLQ